MRILYIHQHYRTAEDWGSMRPEILSRALQGAGHSVTLMHGGETSSSTVDGWGRRVVSIKSPYHQGMGTIRRMTSFFRFAFGAVKAGRKCKADLIYASSTPLTVGIIALALKKMTGMPYIFEVRDVWPEVPFSLGYLRPQLLRKLIVSLTQSIYRNAADMVFLSPQAQEMVCKLYRVRKWSLLSNFSQTDLFQPTPLGSAKRIVYFGSMGVANGLDALLLLAAECQLSRIEVQFELYGDGSERSALEERARRMGLTNLVFFGPIAKKQLPEKLKGAWASYVSFLPDPWLETCSPNKFYDSLALGLPIFLNVKGWMKELIGKENCGIYCDPANPTATADQIKELMEDEARRNEMATNSRLLAVKHFSSSVISSRLMAMMADWQAAGGYPQ